MKKTIATLLLAAFAATASAQSLTVGVYDPNPNHPNQADIDIAIPKAVFTPLVQARWNVNLGGVVNFDQPSTLGWPLPGIAAHNARYGVGMINNMAFSFGGPVNIQSLIPSPWVPISGSPNNGGGLVTGVAGPLLFKFFPTTLVGVPVRVAGFTVLQRMGVAQNVKVEFFLNTGAVLVNGFALPAALPGMLPPADAFVCRAAPAGTSIVGVRVTSVSATGAPLHVAIDDFGFSH